jgi:hypothetical protein
MAVRDSGSLRSQIRLSARDSACLSGGAGAGAGGRADASTRPADEWPRQDGGAPAGAASVGPVGQRRPNRLQKYSRFGSRPRWEESRAFGGIGQQAAPYWPGEAARRLRCSRSSRSSCTRAGKRHRSRSGRKRDPPSRAISHSRGRVLCKIVLRDATCRRVAVAGSLHGVTPSCMRRRERALLSHPAGPLLGHRGAGHQFSRRRATLFDFDCTRARQVEPMAHQRV